MGILIVCGGKYELDFEMCKLKLLPKRLLRYHYLLNWLMTISAIFFLDISIYQRVY